MKWAEKENSSKSLPAGSMQRIGERKKAYRG